MSGSVCVFKNLGAEKNTQSVFKVFFCASVHFKAKPSKVVVKGGDPFFNVDP